MRLIGSHPDQSCVPRGEDLFRRPNRGSRQAPWLKDSEMQHRVG